MVINHFTLTLKQETMGTFKVIYTLRPKQNDILQMTFSTAFPWKIISELKFQ